jgi:hypothetical protein
MILDMKRALRRSHRQRMIARARKSLSLMDMEESDRLSWALRQHDHLKCCSCRMCGNPRKWYRAPTLQELRRDEDHSRRMLGGLDWEL